MAPYADNMYSADDSDDESFSDELSPTDGYFNQRDQSQNVLVPDPSIGSSTAESKAREAREEANSPTTHTSSTPLPPQASPEFVRAPLNVNTASTLFTRSSPPSTTYSPISPRSPQRFQRDQYSEASPLLYSTAPPAYSPASASSQDHHRNYSTISNTSQNQLEEGRALPDHFREPESMGQPLENNNDEREPLFGKPVISRTRRFLQRAILFLAALFLAVSFITATVRRAKDSYKIRDPRPDSPMDSQPESGSPYCLQATSVLWTNSYPFNFNSGHDLNIIQTIIEEHQPNGISVHTAGEIRIRRLPENSPYKTGYITSDVRASNPNINVNQRVDGDHAFVQIATPRTVPRSFSDIGGRPCVSVEITLWVPDGAKLASLKLEAITLTIRVFPEVMAHVADDTYIKTISGNVVFQDSSKATSLEMMGFPSMPKISWWLPNIPCFNPRPEVEVSLPKSPPKFLPQPGPEFSPDEKSRLFTSRRQYIETVSGSVRGTFSLLDYLHIQSISGGLNVSILPQAEDADAPSPAELYLHTKSGSIEGNFPDFQNLASSTFNGDGKEIAIPEREYKTHVESMSGSLKGRFLIGSQSFFKSISGSIRLEMLYDPNLKSSSINPPPYTKSEFSPPSTFGIQGSTPNTSTFSTETMSGSTRITMLNPSSSSKLGSGSPITSLSSTHQGQSGSLHLSYPPEWEGTILASAMSGSIKVGGEGVVVDSERRGGVPKEVRAHKGVGEGGRGSGLVVKGGSGSVEVVVGR